jgi:hypothetical protein
MFHELYRLSHAQLTPRTTAVSPHARSAGKRQARIGLITGAGGLVFVPEGFSGLTLHDLRGRAVWAHRGAGNVRIPDGISQGVLHARFTP